jgi:N-acetylglutamate synthase/N-acetylornithine aminotransferase
MEILGSKDCALELGLGIGGKEVKYWACDFSHVIFFGFLILLSFGIHTDGEYVRINGDYRS